jgi:hypothetical protein
MKKQILLIIFLCAINFMSAQKWIIPERPRFIPVHDFRVGMGYKPFEAAVALENFRNWGMDPFDYHNIIDFEAPTYYSGARYTTNAIFGEYIYQANKWFGVGATLTYFAYFNNYYDAVTDSKVGQNVTQHLSIYPTLRFTWINNPKFSMYSAFGLGQRIVYEYDNTGVTRNDKLRNSVGGHFTLFGFTFGKKTYCFTDLSTFGTQGIFSFGVGYRIISDRK